MENNNRNYMLTDESIIHEGRTLYRIKAIKEFQCQEIVIKEGQLGGYVEGYTNLYDNAWVFDDAKVYNNAKACDNSQVRDLAEISGYIKLTNNEKITGSWVIKLSDETTKKVIDSFNDLDLIEEI